MSDSNYSFCIAIRKGDLGYVKKLVSLGHNPRMDNDLALSWATEFGNLSNNKVIT